MILDSLKTASVGAGGMLVTWMDFLPLAIRVAVGLVTLGYMYYKFRIAKYEFSKTQKEK